MNILLGTTCGVKAMKQVANLQSAAHFGAAFLFTLGSLLSAAEASATVAQTPLLAGGSVPGSLALVPSVEWPTILSMANVGNYSASTQYTGYFDSGKCYQYSHDATNDDRRDSHFYPVSKTTTNTCAGDLWSGNYLNWAATQTIDVFRSALTGGYRVRDTPTETWLEKARHSGQSDTGRRNISGTAITAATAGPSSWTNFRTRLNGYGSGMRFSAKDNLADTTIPVADYVPGTELKDSVHYEVKIRVKVCDASVGLESNCERYSQGHKPIGLMQQYSTEMRYSLFGYLNDSDPLRDGGALRAKQKFIGPILPNGTANPAAEWDATTGVMIKNPNPADATATGNGVADSGAMNYLNKFGQMTTGNHKSNDPVSELYYTALRYFKNQGDVPAYSTLGTDAYRQADGFPVITSWDDPIVHACQKNMLLGIGDVNTWNDKNLPGATSSTGEPTKPTEVSEDTTIDVVTATAKVGQLEAVDLKQSASEYTGRGNSAYIAGMAYIANTTDLRSDKDGKQTISTYWVDVREGTTLKARAENQYWLAAKYGGFKVPASFGDPLTRTTALDEAWWYTNGETLSSGDKRPDNFFVASDGAKMVESLKKAFAQISNEIQSSTTSLAVNSTRLDTDTAVFQSLLNSSKWSGDLLAKRVNSDGSVQQTPIWSAASKLDNLADISTRTILTITPLTTQGDGSVRSTTGRNFVWDQLDTTQKSALQVSPEADTTRAEQRLAFLRGDRSLELTTDDRTKPFRQRASRLGDIANSDPQMIHKQDFGYSRLTWTSGSDTAGAAYVAFRSSTGYQNRTPVVVVGANDGMLHGFDASTTTGGNGGRELFAYVPAGVYPNLARLADPYYSHRYYVDAPPRLGDAWLGTSTGWRTLAIGATGAGGRSVFALDITNPANVTSSSVLWEFSHPNMGYTTGQPALVPLANGKFGVVVTSGAKDVAATNGYVWILDASNGSIIKEFTLNTTGDLGGVLAADTDMNVVADRLFVGDTRGNLWRLDIGSVNTSSWGNPISGGNPMFIAKDATGAVQPITAPLSSAFNEDGKHMVFFGTGSFFRTGDNVVGTNPQIQSFYGIIDTTTAFSGRSSLLKQEIYKEQALSGIQVRAVTENTMTATHKGWYLDLGWLTGTGATGAKGERVVAKAKVLSGRVIFTTMIPLQDPCASGGKSWIMALNLSSGGRLKQVYFDTSLDGNLNDDDTYTENGNPQPWAGISDADGVIKGVTSLYRWLCYAGSGGGEPRCIPVAGSQRMGRQSWRESRN